MEENVLKLIISDGSGSMESITKAAIDRITGSFFFQPFSFSTNT
jgi:hypothetical protein